MKALAWVLGIAVFMGLGIGALYLVFKSKTAAAAKAPPKPAAAAKGTSGSSNVMKDVALGAAAAKDIAGIIGSLSGGSDDD